MKKNQSIVEQLESLKTELLAIEKDVTEKDKLKTALTCNVGYITIHRYLKGEVRKVDLGLKILQSLRELINQRNLEISSQS